MTQRKALDYIAEYILPVRKIDGVYYVTEEIALHLRQVARDALKRKET